MKPASSNRFLASIALAFASFSVAVPADTVTANARTLGFSPDGNDLGALPLFDDGGGNVQRSWLNVVLRAYAGKVLTTDATMTLQAGIYGNSLNGVQFGSANASWTAGRITWNNSPGLTITTDVIKPSGTVGPVTWTIPWYVVEKWTTAGYPAITVATGLNASIGAAIVGIDGLERLGTGTLTLSGGNTHSGVTRITGGTLLATSDTALGLGGHNGATMSFIQDGTTLALQGGVSLDEHFHVWGAGGLGAVRSISGDNALTNNDLLTALTINDGGLVRSDGQDCHIWNITGGVSMNGGDLQTNGAVSSGTGNALQWN